MVVIKAVLSRKSTLHNYSFQSDRIPNTSSRGDTESTVRAAVDKMEINKARLEKIRIPNTLSRADTESTVRAAVDKMEINK